METNTVLNLPLVSVCIPAYNSAKHIRATMTSVLQQTYPNIEVIIVDDGSEDETLQIVNEFKNSRVTILQSGHKGASASRNAALRHARGNYIQFMDADDLLSEDKIALQVTALAGSRSKVAVCSTVHFFDGDSPFLASPSVYEENFLYSSADPASFLAALWGARDFQASMVQPNAWLTPRALIDLSGEWNETLTLDDDGEFFARVILNAGGIVRSGGLNYYRKHRVRHNLSSQNNRTALYSYYTSTLLKVKYLIQKRDDELTRRAVFKQLTDLAVRCYSADKVLYSRVNKMLEDFPAYPYQVTLGGKMINMVSRLAGWRLAKKLQSYIR